MTDSGTSDHNRSHEELLQQVICGDIARDDPKVQALLDSCQGCRQEFAELEQLTDLLDLDASSERDARSGSDYHGSGAPPVLGSVPSLGRTLRRLRTPILAAAAILAVTSATYLLGPGSRTNSPDPIVLIGAPIQLEAIDGSTPFEGFRWKGELPPGGTYRIRVWNPGTVVTDPTLVDEDNLTQPSYVPSPEQASTLPTTVVWLVDIVSVEGSTEISSFRAEAAIRRE